MLWLFYTFAICDEAPTVSHRGKKTCPHLSASNSQHLSERYYGIPTMEVHQVLQTLVTPVLPYYDVLIVFQCINHKMSAAVLNAEESVHKNEQDSELLVWV